MRYSTTALQPASNNSLFYISCSERLNSIIKELGANAPVYIFDFILTPRIRKY